MLTPPGGVVNSWRGMKDRDHSQEACAFPGQFVLVHPRSVAATSGLLPDWCTYQLTSHWALLTSPEIPVTSLLDEDGQELGRVLGPLVGSGEPTIVSTRTQLPPTRALEQLCGGWLAIMDWGGDLIALPDPIASVPLVFDHSRRLAGSTPELLDYVHGSPAAVAPDAFTEMDLRADYWYPFGLCPQKDVQRLLPNHLLDLVQLRPSRVQPAPPAETDSESLALDRLEAALRKVFQDLNTPLTVPLTAGRDSRLILAAALAAGHTPRTFTLVGDVNDADQIVAPRLAGAAGVAHEFHRMEGRSPVELELWFRRTGRTVGGKNLEFRRPAASMPIGALELSGAGGESMRGFYWQGQLQPSRPDPSRFVSRIGLPKTTRFVEAADSWLQGLPDLSPDQILDLAYCELRMGCWASPQIYGRLRPWSQFFAFGQPEVLDAMARLPISLRASGRAADILVPRLAPSLKGLPFNRGPLGTKLLSKMSRLKSPRDLVRKLIQKLS